MSVYKGTMLQIKHPEIQKLFLNSTEFNFDLFIYECVMCPFMALADIYNCPVVLTLSVDPPNMYQHLIGNSVHSSINPEITLFPYIYGNFTFLVRMLSFLADKAMNILNLIFLKISDFMLYCQFPNIEFPSQIHAANKRVKLYYAFTYHTTTNIRPTVPYYNQLGFVHLQPPKEIADIKIKNFLDRSSNGVVVMCFGSVTTELNDDIYSIFIDTFKELPFNVIWKISLKNSTKFVMPENILTSEWLPLDDILGHENLKLIIAHAGMKTIEEAIDREVPMVLIPINYDQPFNAAYQVEHGIATILDLNKITKESLKEAVMEMTKQKYKENIRLIRNQTYDRMASSLNEAIWNIEHLIKHSQTHTFQSYERQYKYGYFFEIFHNVFEYFLMFIFSISKL